PGLVLDVAASRIPAETQVFPDRELTEGPASLRNVRDSRARSRLRTTRQLLPGEHHVAAAAHRAGDGSQRRCLPGAVRAEHGDQLALADPERDAVQGLHRAVTRLDVLKLQDHYAGA